MLQHILAEDKILDTIEGVTSAYNESVKQSTELSILKQEQAQNEKYINNILTAIKMVSFQRPHKKSLLNLNPDKQNLKKLYLFKKLYSKTNYLKSKFCSSSNNLYKKN